MADILRADPACMNDERPRGRRILLDPNAQSADPELPAFLARPSGAPVYHGFPLIEETRTEDGWCFGAITEFTDDADAGDAFVEAPDGTRAGIVWQVGSGEIAEILPPEPSRWGVYAVWFQDPIASRDKFVAALLALVPQLRRIHERVIEKRSAS
jgi:hypothetical protein